MTAGLGTVGTGSAGTGTTANCMTGTGIGGFVGYEKHGFSKNKFESRFETNGTERVGLDNYFQTQGRSRTLTNLLDEKSSRSKNRGSENSKLETEKSKKYVSPGGTTYAEKKVHKKKLIKSKSINYSKSSRPELIPIKPSSSPKTYEYHKSSTVAKYNFAERGLSLVSSSSDEASHRPPLVIVSSRNRNDDQF